MSLSEMHGHDIEFARQESALALASLFRPITKGPRPGGLECWTQFKGVDIHFAIWQALDSRDQSVLLSIIGMAGIEHDEINATHNNDLWHRLEPIEQAKKDKAVVVTTSRYKLIQAAGLSDSGTYYGILEACLRRLSAVSCHAYSKTGDQWSMRFLSYAENADGQLQIALNGRFAHALSSQHSRIELTERRSLKGDASKIAHAWLSAWMRRGESRVIGIDKLANHVWSVESTNSSTKSTRRDLIGKALAKIDGLNTWSVEIYGRGKQSKARIKRSNLIHQSQANYAVKTKTSGRKNEDK